MADISTIWDPNAGHADWAATGSTLGFIADQDGVAISDDAAFPIYDGLVSFAGAPGLAAGGDLVTAVIISLYTDAAANQDDPIRDGSADPRGWWAGPIGSKVWLRLRSKRSAELLATVKDDIASALAWLIADGVASAVNVAVEWQSPSRLGAQISIERTAAAAIVLSFAWAWEAD